MIYAKFFRGYTRKQWGLDLSELSAGVAARIPTRTNDDDRYFTDTYQLMPAQGYTVLFRRMLDHPNIRVQLSVDYFAHRAELRAVHTIYTGPIDAFLIIATARCPTAACDLNMCICRINRYSNPLAPLIIPMIMPTRASRNSSI